MPEKTCFKCNRLLPISEFYTHPKMPDGHVNKCKECTKKEVNERRLELSKSPQWLDAELERCRLKSQRYRATGRAKPIPTETKRATLKRYREKYPEKDMAQRLLKAAVDSGLIVRKPCHCGEVAEAHHEDYSKPLDVVWLCSKHHAERHVELRRHKRLSAIK